MELVLLQMRSIGNSIGYLLKKALYAGVLLPFIYCLCMGLICYRLELFTDWDGVIHYLSGIDIYQGNGYRGWASHFWPPLYALLSGTLASWQEGMQGAKMISVIAASLLLWVAHRFVYMLSANNAVACLAQLFIALNFTFVALSIKAENHMLDSLFYVLAIYLLLQSLDPENTPRYWWVGVVCGLAGLTRYTSYSLIPAFVITLFLFYTPRQAMSYAARIVAGFVLVSVPWWLVNYLNNGSPLATWQYMNVGAGVFTTPDNKWWWWWSGIDDFQSITDIILHAPGPFFANFFRNAFKSVWLIIVKGQLTGIFFSAAILVFLFRQVRRNGVALLRNRLFLPVFITLLCFIGLVSQAFVFSEVFLSWLVLVAVYGIYAIYRLGKGLRRSDPAYKPALLTFMLCVIGFDLFYTVRLLNSYIYDTTGMEETRQITAALQQADESISQKVIMSFHPGRAYHLGAHYIMLPPYYKGDIGGLVTFRGMSYKVKDHAPRFPSTININELKVDYLVYDGKAAELLPQYAFLLEDNSPRIPANFQRVYRSDKVAVYKIN